MSKVYSLSKENWFILEKILGIAYDITNKAIEVTQEEREKIEDGRVSLVFMDRHYIIQPPSTYKGMETFSTQNE